MPFLPLLLLLVALAVAGGDRIAVTLLVDDRGVGRLDEAQVVVEEDEAPVTAPITDDGACAGDMPGDGIHVACFSIRKRETLSFGVLEGSGRLGAFNLFLPNADEATVSLRTRQGNPALLMDMAAERPVYSAPDQDRGDRTPRDRILVMVTIDDRVARGLKAPELRALDRDDQDPVQASDAGLLLGDRAGDWLWRADMTVLRTDELTLGLFDGGRKLGEASVTLPAKQRAYLRMELEGGELVASLSEEAPAADAVEEESSPTILLMLGVDDSALESLVAPEIRVTDRAGVEPVRASDAGLLLGDRAEDHVWRADLTVERTDTLDLALVDRGETIGELQLELPPKRRAYVVIERAGDGELVAEHRGEFPRAETLEESSTSILVMLALDDRAEGRLKAPELRVTDRDGVEPVRASDAGLLLGDQPQDGIWRADLTVERTETLGLALYDEGERLGTIELDLPTKRRAYLVLGLSDEGSGLALMDSPDTPPEAIDRDTILLMLALDDRADGALKSPELRVTDRAGVEPVRASDAGLLLGDRAEDGIWRADLTVERTETLALALFDEGEQLGTIELDLPTKRRAYIVLGLSDRAPGLVLLDSPETPPDQIDRDTILLMLALDDRAAGALKSPELRVTDRGGVEPVAASDAGLMLGDEADDHIWRADLTVERTDTLALALFDEGEERGTIELDLPTKRRAYIVLELSDEPPGLVLGDSPDAPPDEVDRDTILLMVALDDRAREGLEDPELRVTDRSGGEPVEASDAGLLLGDEADDHIWRADLTVERTDTLALALFDGEEPLGTLDLELPTKRRVAVVITQDEQGAWSAEFDEDLPSEENLESAFLYISIVDNAGLDLQAPTVAVNGQEAVEPATASDAGLLTDDVAGDGIWRADMMVVRTPTLSMSLRDGERVLGNTTFSLPSASEVGISMVLRGDPAVLTATTEAIGEASALETMSLVISVDDRAAGLLGSPGLRTGTRSARAFDDGSIPGDKAGDDIWLAELEVTRVPALELELTDEGEVVGSVEVPLPATGSAEVYLRTRQGSPAVMLVEMLERGGAGGGGGGGGSAGFWTLLWVNLAFFLVIAAWVRRTMRRAIERELSARLGTANPPQQGAAEPQPPEEA